jgi:hypothetical protein
MKATKKADNLWKEQLSFTSGVILIWGIALLKLYPFAAHLPSGGRVLTKDGRADATGFAGGFLTLLVALGGATLICAFVHITSRGLWLAQTVVSEETSAERKQRFDRMCRMTFAAVFRLASVTLWYLAFIPLWLFVLLLQRLLHYVFGVQSLGVGRVLLGVAVVFCAMVIYLVLRRLNSLRKARGEPKLQLWDLDRLSDALVGGGRPATGMAVSMFAWSVLFVSIFARTVEIKLNTHTMYQSKGDVLEIMVTLGGSTSQFDKAVITLSDSTGSVTKTIQPEPLEEGRYIAHLYASSLPLGRYEITLVYDVKLTLTHRYPFISGQIRKTRAFFVAE